MPFDINTKCVYIKDGIDTETGAVNPPIYQTAGFSYPDPNDLENIFLGRDYGYVYSRMSNPTIYELERKITYLESGLGSIAVSSGLSAIFSVVMVLAETNQNIIVSNSLFGGTRDLFEETIPKLGIDVRFVDFSQSDNVFACIDENTAFVFAEIISNPKLIIPDISELTGYLKKKNIPFVLDATLTGSVGFSTKASGVDVVIYSSTKLFASNGGAVGGIIVDTGNYDWRKSSNNDILASSKKVNRFAFIERIRRHALNNAGLNTSPMNAYFTLIGLETLALRYERICENALKIAQFFESEGLNVYYPGLESHDQHVLASKTFVGFGPLLTIDLGTKSAAFSFIKRLKIVQNMTNLGDNRTMVIHPKSTIFSKHSDQQLLDAGVTDGLVRINVGIESINDLISEFKEALK